MKEANNNIPQHWKIVELKSIAESIQYGYTESSSKEKIGPKFLRITDIQDNKVEWDTVPYCKIDKESKKKYLLKDGDLLFARTGATVGKSFLIKGNIPETIFASYLIRVRVNQELNDNFLSYFFHSLDYWSQITEGQVGIGQPNVNGTKLGNLNIPLPPLPEQIAIVNKIEELFSELENGKEQLLTAQRQLKVYRQSLLKAAFEGRLTNENVKDGELPDGWKWVKIDSLLSDKKKGMTTGPFGTMLKKSDYQKHGVPILGIENIGEGIFQMPNRNFLSNEKAKELKSFTVKESDLIISRSGTVGEICLIPKQMENSIISSNLMKVSLNQEIVFTKYFVYLFLGGKVRQQVFELCKGSSRAFLNQTILNSLDFPLPPLPVQQAIVEILESKLTVCDKLEELISHSLEQTETLRQSILKKAFEGKLYLD